jgi:hypothetical protein
MVNQLYVAGVGVNSILVTIEEIFYTYMPFLAKPNKKSSAVAAEPRFRPPHKSGIFFIIDTPNGW